MRDKGPNKQLPLEKQLLMCHGVAECMHALCMRYACRRKAGEVSLATCCG